MPDPRLLAGSLACLVTAGALALVGIGSRDLRSSRPAVTARSDLGLANAAPSRSFPERLAAGIAGLGDDRRFVTALRAVAATRRARSSPARARRSEAALAALDAARSGERDQRRRAELDDLRGVLTLVAATARRPAEQQRALEQAISTLQAAVREDPAGEQAKFNLELALTLSVAAKHGGRLGARGSGGKGRGGPRSKARGQGAGAGSPNAPGLGY